MQHTLEATAKLIAGGQKAGELRSDVAPFVAASMLFGAIEISLTTFVLGAFTAAEGVEKAKRDLLAIFLQGMAPPERVARAPAGRPVRGEARRGMLR
jgi:TetR/AcrR family transcriptional regulator, fatty acid metabolism regulator protein